MDKPEGPTSHDVVARVRRVMRERRVGHTGTLDPFATGLLVVVLGRATRLARFVEQQSKTYAAIARLGVATDTDDRTGAVIGGTPRRVSREEVLGALAELARRTLQRPPAYSARKVDGERSYRRARRGEAVTLGDATVQVEALTLEGLAGDDVHFRTTVSPGTYVRAMARDLGELLGTGAHLTALRREAIGALRVEDATPLDALAADTPLLDPTGLVAHLPSRALTAEEATGVRRGRRVPWTGADAPAVRLMDDDRLVAIAEASGGAAAPRVVLDPA